MYRALYDFRSAEANSLAFAAGEAFVILERSNQYWWLASKSSGDVGYVPVTYIRRDETENKDAVILSIDRAIEAIHNIAMEHSGKYTLEQREVLQKLIHHRKETLAKQGQARPSQRPTILTPASSEHKLAERGSARGSDSGGGGAGTGTPSAAGSLEDDELSPYQVPPQPRRAAPVVPAQPEKTRSYPLEKLTDTNQNGGVARKSQKSHPAPAPPPSPSRSSAASSASPAPSPCATASICSSSDVISRDAADEVARGRGERVAPALAPALSDSSRWTAGGSGGGGTGPERPSAGAHAVVSFSVGGEAVERRLPSPPLRNSESLQGGPAIPEAPTEPRPVPARNAAASPPVGDIWPTLSAFGDSSSSSPPSSSSSARAAPPSGLPLSLASQRDSPRPPPAPSEARRDNSRLFPGVASAGNGAHRGPAGLLAGLETREAPPPPLPARVTAAGAGVSSSTGRRPHWNPPNFTQLVQKLLSPERRKRAACDDTQGSSLAGSSIAPPSTRNASGFFPSIFAASTAGAPASRARSRDRSFSLPSDDDDGAAATATVAASPRREPERASQRHNGTLFSEIAGRDFPRVHAKDVQSYKAAESDSSDASGHSTGSNSSRDGNEKVPADSRSDENSCGDDDDDDDGGGTAGTAGAAAPEPTPENMDAAVGPAGGGRGGDATVERLGPGSPLAQRATPEVAAANGAESPLRRRDALLRRLDSPLKRSESLFDRLDSPVRSCGSPVRCSDSPVHCADSPVRFTDSPARCHGSPAHRPGGSQAQRPAFPAQATSGAGSPLRRRVESPGQTTPAASPPVRGDTSVNGASEPPLRSPPPSSPPSQEVARAQVGRRSPERAEPSVAPSNNGRARLSSVSPPSPAAEDGGGGGGGSTGAVPRTMGVELTELVRRNTGLSYELSRVAIGTVVGHIRDTLPDTADIMEDILLSLLTQQDLQELPEGLECQDVTRLNVIFTDLARHKDDAQQRSWALHEDEAVISSYLQELLSILTDANPDVSRRMCKRDDCEPVLSLVSYYQMEHRVSLRLLLLKVFGAMCSLDANIISALLNSVLPMELARDMQTDTKEHQKLCYSTLLLTMVFSMGEPLPYHHYDHLNESFMGFVLDVTENGLPSDTSDQLPDLMVNLLLAFNLHFQVPSSNVIMETLARRLNIKTFSEKLLLLLNRGEDPVDMFEHAPRPPHSVLKFLQDMFCERETAAIFYHTDMLVMIDIIVRQLSDLSAGDKMRMEYLSLMLAIMRSTDYVQHSHRGGDLRACFRRIAAEEGGEGDQHCRMDRDIVCQICTEFPAFGESA
ncbi:NCK-interacting protein with SH3 domain isoform X2 [Petromyzon marinus]|uniref:NCK-interacting protein with SH3 domain isoform X2 n=1 Tax=Petromyzon marinus TaxID=7757 RepID=UPI003F729CF4